MATTKSRSSDGILSATCLAFNCVVIVIPSAQDSLVCVCVLLQRVEDAVIRRKKTDEITPDDRGEQCS